MKLTDFFRDGEAEAETAVLAGRRLIRLPEAFENIGKKLGSDADAGIVDNAPMISSTTCDRRMPVPRRCCLIM